MEYPSHESTSSAFSAQISITSTQDNFSQNRMEYSSQGSMSSLNNMDISSQNSSDCDKMLVSSQETSLDKLEFSPELKKTDETEFSSVATNDPYSMNISSSGTVANLTENILSNENPKVTSSENMGILSIENREFRAQEICPQNENYKVQSSINFCTQEKIINCEAMSISSQGSSGSQTMDISSQETLGINAETVFEMSNSKKREVPQSDTGGIEEPVLAKKHCCCGRCFQIQKITFNIRKRHRAMMKRETALKNRETRLAEREASILRRENELKAREQKILNYEAAVFHSGK